MTVDDGAWQDYPENGKAYDQRFTPLYKDEHDHEVHEPESLGELGGGGVNRSGT